MSIFPNQQQDEGVSVERKEKGRNEERKEEKQKKMRRKFQFSFYPFSSLSFLYDVCVCVFLPPTVPLQGGKQKRERKEMRSEMRGEELRRGNPNDEPYTNYGEKEKEKENVNQMK